MAKEKMAKEKTVKEVMQEAAEAMDEVKSYYEATVEHSAAQQGITIKPLEEYLASKEGIQDLADIINIVYADDCACHDFEYAVEDAGIID